ncbi:phage tail tape measure protein [Streptosporangium sp. G12]
MSLSLGELHGIIDLEDKGFDSGVDAAEKAMSGLQGATTQVMASVEGTVTRSLAQVEQAIADGLDPTSAIADLDRLEAELDASLREMEAEAEAFARELDASIDEAFASLDDDAQASGQRAGDQLTDGLRTGLNGAREVARETGDDVGRGLGDGVEASGQSRLSGVATNLVGGLKAGAAGLALAAGAAIGAALMSGLNSALDGEAARAKLFAQIGASEEEMGRLGRVAGEVYSQGYGEGLGDVTDSIKSLIQNVDGVRGASEESLGALSKHALNAATILDEDVNRVTAAVGNILKNNLAPNAEAAFDVIIKGAQDGVNKSEDLLDTFNEYSTQFRELGLSAGDALGLMSQGLKAGARDSDTVADALKEFAIRAKDGSETSKTAFEGIGLDANKMFQVFAKGGPGAKAALGDVIQRLKEVKDPVEQDAIAVGLFGTKAEDLQDALFALNPATAATSLGTLAGAAKSAGDTLHDTATNKIEVWKRGMTEGVVNFLGGTVIPALEKAAEGFSMSGALETLQGWKEQVGLIWDGVVADVQEWVAANSATIEEWKTKLSEGFESAKTVVSDVLTVLKELWDKYGQDVIATVTGLVSTFLSIWNAFWGVVSGLVKTAKGVMTGDFTLLKEGLRQIWDSLWKLIEDILTGALGTIKRVASEAWTSLKNDAVAVWENLKKSVSEKITSLIADVKAIPEKTKAVFSGAGTWLLQAGKDMILGFVNGIKNMAGAAVDAAKSVVKGAVDGVRNLLDEHSPSKVFHLIGENTIQGWINGVLAKGALAVTAVKTVMKNAKAAAEEGFGDSRAAIDAAITAAMKKQKAAQQKVNLIGGTSITDSPGVAMDGGGGFGGGSAPGGVTVNMYDTVVRDPVDIPKVGAQFGFEYTARA